MIKWIKNWWSGEIITYKDEYCFGIGIDRHWTSVLAHKIVKLYVKNWQWFWGIVVAIVVAQPWGW